MKWTMAENEFLRKNKTKTTKELAEMFGRTIGSVKKKRNNLGIDERTDWWSGQEKKYLRENYKTKSLYELRKHLGKTKSSVQQKAYNLELKKDWKWSTKEEENIRKYYPTAPWSFLLKLFPKRNRLCIANRSHILNVKRTKREWTAKSIERSLNRKNFNRWTKEEIETLVKYYPICSRKELEKKLPKRNWSSISSKANNMSAPLHHLKRERKYIKRTSFHSFHIDSEEEKFLMSKGNISVYLRGLIEKDMKKMVI